MSYVTANFGAAAKRKDQPPKKVNVDGEHRLWVAVLAQVIGDALLTPKDGEQRRERELSIAMIEKIAPQFQMICSLVGIDAREVRERWLAGAIKDPGHILKVSRRGGGTTKRRMEYEARMAEAQRLLAAGMTREQIATQLGRSLHTINEYIAGGPKHARRAA